MKSACDHFNFNFTMPFYSTTNVKAKQEMVFCVHIRSNFKAFLYSLRMNDVVKEKNSKQMREGVTAGEAFSGSARIPEPILVPIIKATAPAIVPLLLLGSLMGLTSISKPSRMTLVFAFFA